MGAWWDGRAGVVYVYEIRWYGMGRRKGKTAAERNQRRKTSVVVYM